MNSNKFFYSLMKLNVLSSDYVDNSYKLAWEKNIYPLFHDSKYEFHLEVAKGFDRVDEKAIDKLCSFIDDYVDEHADFTGFEECAQKIVGNGNVVNAFDYIFQSNEYSKLLDNIILNKAHFSSNFVDLFRYRGYWD